MGRNRAEMRKDWVEEVREKNGGCFSYSYDRVGGAGRLLVSLCPVKVNLVVQLGQYVGIVHRVVPRVVRGVGVSR